MIKLLRKNLRKLLLSKSGMNYVYTIAIIAVLIALAVVILVIYNQGDKFISKIPLEEKIRGFG